MKWNEVTWYSRWGAIILFLIILPTLSFYLGVRYQNVIQISEYEHLQSEITKGSNNLTVNGDIEYKIVTKTTIYSTSTIPQITQFKDPAIMALVNNRLQKLYATCSRADMTIDDLRAHLIERNSYSMGKHYTDAEIKNMNEEQLFKALGWYAYVDSKVTNASNNVFSVNINYDYGCGGAHPARGNSSVTFDLNTGKEVSFKELFVNFEKDKKLLAEIIFPISSNSTDSIEPDGKCGTDTGNLGGRSNFEYSSFYISNGTLFVVPNLPFALTACGKDAEVRISKISQYIYPNGILARFN